ncbi:MAG: tetratricopeptide repeat protein [Acidobacteria bacterium]|nr:tetratricopeptide repeat protein [Acidobacteriota bacterium]MBI3423155.1 tetratricopeptide repeat protein [Acidobacteriota bacterium]
MPHVFRALVLVALLACAALAQTFQEADRLFTYGDDTGRDQQALAVIEKALASDGNNYQWLWRAARARYYVGDEAKADKLKHFESGIAYAQRAIAQSPNAVEGHFWLGASYGGYSEVKGAFSALATVKKIRAEMETVLRLNAGYEDARAYLALGELDRQLPRLLGGNVERAITRLEAGLKIAPRNLEMKYALAQAYQENGRKEDARRQLNELTQASARNQAERNIQGKARALLTKL